VISRSLSPFPSQHPSPVVQQSGQLTSQVARTERGSPPPFHPCLCGNSDTACQRTSRNACLPPRTAPAHRSETRLRRTAQAHGPGARLPADSGSTAPCRRLPTRPPRHRMSGMSGAPAFRHLAVMRPGQGWWVPGTHIVFSTVLQTVQPQRRMHSAGDVDHGFAGAKPGRTCRNCCPTCRLRIGGGIRGRQEERACSSW